MTGPAVDSAFDSVAFATVGLVRWPAAAHATLLSVADLVGLLRDGAADAASAQVGAVRARAVRPIRAEPVGLGARASRTDARDTDAVEHILEPRAVMAVAGGDDQGQRFLPLFDREMELGRQSAPGASESVVGRFGVAAAGRFSLESPFFFSGAGGMLVCAGDGGVDADVPGDQPVGVGPGLELVEDSLPGPIALPAPEQPIDGFPRAVPDRHVPPRRTRPCPSPNAVNQLPLGPDWRPSRLLPHRQHRLQPGPL